MIPLLILKFLSLSSYRLQIHTDYVSPVFSIHYRQCYFISGKKFHLFHSIIITSMVSAEINLWCVLSYTFSWALNVLKYFFYFFRNLQII